MESIKDIRAKFEAAEESALPFLIEQYVSDERSGVQSLVNKGRKSLQKKEEETARIREMKAFENKAAGDYLTTGYICGIDEAGRGPLAGPVAAGAVILPKDSELLYINDSKKLTAQKRDELFDRIREEAVSYAVALVPAHRIDEINILQATYEAMRSAVSKLDPQPEVLVNDAVRIPQLRIPQVPIIKGDAKCYSIAAASILAKVTRDRLMMEYDALYPEYGFAGNKGYGAAEHIKALREIGPCPIHRRSFIGNFVDLRRAGAAEEEAGEVISGGRNHRRIGTDYEDKAAAFLETNGVRILEHSFRSYNGEIDLIGIDADNVLVFAEVKFRQGDLYAAAEAVDVRKTERIRRTAQYYCLRNGISQENEMRFDVIAMDGESIEWIRNAF